MVAGRQDSAATARDEWAESDRASAIACSSVIVEPSPLPRFLSEHHYELAFEVELELVLCS